MSMAHSKKLRDRKVHLLEVIIRLVPLKVWWPFLSYSISEIDQTITP